MNKLSELIEDLYPKDKHYVLKALENAYDGNLVEGEKDKDWYKKLTIYVSYPDTFVDRDGEANLDTLRKKLGYISRLGCNCLHILPFLSSPMIDGGFDVSEYFLVREELGGNLAFENLLEKAKEMGIKVMMDIVLNHVSYEHRWYKMASSGDSFYRQFFICQEKNRFW